MNFFGSIQKIYTWFAGLSFGRKIVALFLYFNVFLALFFLFSGEFGGFLWYLITGVIIFPIAALNPLTILLGIYDALMTAREAKKTTKIGEVVKVEDSTPLKLLEDSEFKNLSTKNKGETLKSKLKELKRLNDEGLISAEEYKKLREKNLGL